MDQDSYRYDKLLIELLKLNGNMETGSIIDNLSSEELDAVVNQAVWHTLAAPVYQQLEKIDIPAFSVEAKKRLQSLYHYNDWNNRIVHEKLRLLLSKLKEQNIEVIALKGAHLIAVVYKKYALRTISDIDLLIHKQDCHEIEDILEKIGYQPVGNREEYEKKHFHFVYRLTEPGFKSHIELHWNLHPTDSPIKIDLDNMWKRSQRITILDEPIRVLSPEDFMLHQCLHLAVQHFFKFGLRPLYDIKQALITYDNDFDWDLFLERVEECNLQKGSYATLFIVKHVMQVSIPDRILAALKPEDLDQSLIDTAIANIFRPNDSSKEISTGLAVLATTKNPLKIAKLLYKTIFLPSNDLKQRYRLPHQSRIFWFYYLVRSIDVLQRNFKPLLAMLRKRPEILEKAELSRTKHRLRNWLNSV